MWGGLMLFRVTMCLFLSQAPLAEDQQATVLWQLCQLIFEQQPNWILPDWTWLFWTYLQQDYLLLHKESTDQEHGVI